MPSYTIERVSLLSYTIVLIESRSPETGNDPRYVAIKHALGYETLVTTRRLTAAIANAWAIPVVFTLSTLINVMVTSDFTILYAITFLAIPGCLTAIFFCQATFFSSGIPTISSTHSGSPGLRSRGQGTVLKKTKRLEPRRWSLAMSCCLTLL